LVEESKRRFRTLETQLQYGTTEMNVEIPSSEVTVLRTKH
jgi:hypothetical protein